MALRHERSVRVKSVFDPFESFYRLGKRLRLAVVDNWRSVIGVKVCQILSVAFKNTYDFDQC